MKALRASVIRADAWILDRLFQPIIAACPDPIRMRPTILALIFLFAGSAYLFGQLLVIWWNYDQVIPKMIVITACTTGIWVLCFTAISLIRSSSRHENWFRDSGALVRYACLIVTVLSLIYGAWFSVEMWLWWLATCVMACYPVPPRTLNGP